MNELPPRPNLSVKEIAAFLGVSPQKVYELVAVGDMPSKRIDRVIRIPREEFIQWYKKLPSASEFEP